MTEDNKTATIRPPVQQPTFPKKDGDSQKRDDKVGSQGPTKQANTPTVPSKARA